MTTVVLATVAAWPALHANAQSTDSPGSGGMMQGGPGGMLGQGEMPDLKELPPERVVQAVRYCTGRYVSTAAGDILEFREFDFRFKTDSSDKGPDKGKPGLLPAGGMGDRGFLIFAQPDEISGYIKNDCGAP